jgi:2-dehydro-3-deoxyphosphogluconate aldolase/(4S)-4-hydroxy-2-oxoglutarate aldolase
MAQFMKHEVVQSMMEIGLVPVFYNKDVETAKKIVEACAQGGARAIEFTNRGDFAWQVFAEVTQWAIKNVPGAMMGVGSIVDAPTAALYINNGANFVVGPVFNPDVAKMCNRRKVPYSPGCGSASEISAAEEMGCDIVKVFPGGEVGGPNFVKNMLGPCPWTKIMPTGGVEATKENIAKWIKAGAACLGMGSNLITKELVAQGDYAGITKNVEDCLGHIQEARGIPLFTGLEHVALYPQKEGGAPDLVKWYAETFGLKLHEGGKGYFVGSVGTGRIEVMKKPEYAQPHIAIRVSHFGRAYEYLKSKGIELDEPLFGTNSSAAFFKKTDPFGNRVHIIHIKQKA